MASQTFRMRFYRHACIKCHNIINITFTLLYKYCKMENEEYMIHNIYMRERERERENKLNN